MGLRSYARHRQSRGLPGGWLRAVQVAIEEGRIPVHVVNGESFVDPEEADLAWDANTAPQMGKTTGGNGGGRYSDTKAALAEVELERRRLDLAKQRGELVDAKQVQREAFETARAVRERLGSLPPRLAALVMASAATGSLRAVEELIAAEIHDALRELAGGESCEG